MLAILQDMIREVLNYTYPACLLTILFSMAFILAGEKGLKSKLAAFWYTRKKLILFLLSLSFVLMATVFGRQTTMPLKSVFTHMFFVADNEGWNNEIIENVFLFIPLTYLFLNSFEKRPDRPVRYAFLLALGTSLFAELSQLLFWLGHFQFSDILYNTIGGMLGCLLWYGVCRWFPGKGTGPARRRAETRQSQDAETNETIKMAEQEKTE